MVPAPTAPVAPKHPRKAGVFLLAVGLAACGFNAWMLSARDRYFPKLVVIAPVAVAMGRLFAAVPSAYGKAGPGEWWKNVAQVAALLVGLGAGCLHWWLLSHS